MKLLLNPLCFRTLLMSVLVCLSCQVHAQLIEYSMTHQINLGLSDVIIRDNGDYLFTASAISPTYDSIMALTILTNSSFEVQQVNRYKSLNEDDFSCALQLSNGNYLVAGAMRWIKRVSRSTPFSLKSFHMRVPTGKDQSSSSVLSMTSHSGR